MKQTFTYWIYVKARGSQLVYELSDIEWTESNLHGRVLLDERTLTLELPELQQAMSLVVAALEAKKKQMLAVSQAAINEVDAQIQSLLALEAPLEEEDGCDSCHDDITIDCHDCEQHQHAIEDGLLKVDA